MPINFPLCTAFAVSHKFWYAVFVSIYFLILSLTHWLFRTMLFNFHVFVNFPVFSYYL